MHDAEVNDLGNSGDPSDGRPVARLLFITSLALLYAALVALAMVAPGYEQVLEQLQMRHLPMPTEAALGLARLMRAFWWLVLVGFAAIGVWAARGGLDRFTIRLAIANVVATGVCVMLLIACVLPIWEIQRKLAQ